MTREFPGESRYVVTVPLAMVKVNGRGYVMLHHDAAVPANIDPQQREHLLRGGMIALRSDLEPEDLSTITRRPRSHGGYATIDDEG